MKTDPEQTARFQKIAEAYQTLSKPKLRSDYDLTLKATQSMKVYETTSGGGIKTEMHR